MTLCLIPARSGSKRLPGKNWLTVGGKTLVQRAVDCALGAGLKPYVVTDSGAPVKEHPGAVTLIRPDELAGDDVPTSAVVAWARQYMGDSTSPVVLLQPTSPLTTPEDVRGCRQVFQDCYGRADVVSVVARNREFPPSVTYAQLRQVDTGHTVTVQRERRETAHAYERNGAIYIMRGNEIQGWTQLYVMPPERSVDIDTAADLEEARRLAGG